MANYKKYQVIGASNYEVNKIGQVFNKNGKKLTPRKDGRYKIINDKGIIIYITAEREFMRADYIPKHTPGRYRMGNDYPNYEVDDNANIYNIHSPHIALNPDRYGAVRITNVFGDVVRMNRFRAFAVYKCCQYDTGYVRVIDTAYNGEGGIDISNEPLSNRQVKMIHSSLRNVRLEALYYHADIAMVYTQDGSTVIPMDWYEGRPIPYIMREFEGSTVPLYLTTFREISWKVNSKGDKMPIYEKIEMCMVPLKILLMDPNVSFINKKLVSNFKITLEEYYKKSSDGALIW